MVDTLIKIAQFVLALSLLVLVHELGHFFFARLFKIRVEKFYLFFDAGFALFRYKPKNSDTEYGIGWLPLGGYCKISGMIDESMDKEQMKQPPQPWEFRSKPAWQRLFVMVGGVLFNIILAVLIYAGTLFISGDRYLANNDINAGYGYYCDSLATEMGFQTGDKILALDGKPVERFLDIQSGLIFDQVKTATIERNGQQKDITISEDFLPKLIGHENLLFEPLIPFVVAEVPDTSQNAAAGLLKGDKLVGIDTFATSWLQPIQQVLQRHKGQEVTAKIQRNDSIFTIPLKVNKEGLLGVSVKVDYYPVTEKHYGFFAAIPAGISKGYKEICNYLKNLRLIAKPKTKAYEKVGSLISIGNMFPSAWDWSFFWRITAWLSIMLAVMNLLPIPMLDGGHIMFVLYEMVTRRKPSDKFLEVATIVGMVLVIGLMVYALGNDIFRHFISK